MLKEKKQIGMQSVEIQLEILGIIPGVLNSPRK